VFIQPQDSAACFCRRSPHAHLPSRRARQDGVVWRVGWSTARHRVLYIRSAIDGAPAPAEVLPCHAVFYVLFDSMRYMVSVMRRSGVPLPGYRSKHE